MPARYLTTEHLRSMSQVNHGTTAVSAALLRGRPGQCGCRCGD